MPTLIVLALALTLFAATSPCFAQGWRGVVRGVVLDPSGARVAAAQVSARSAATDIVREVLSEPNGEFAIPELSPGAYIVEARAPGHKTWRRDVDLEVNQERRLEIHLALGEVTEVVQVAATPGARDRGTLGTTIRSTEIQTLPLDGRNFLELALLTPASAPAAPGSASSVRGDFALTANGAREDFNSFLLDGVDNVDPKLNTVAIRPAVDAIREFEVLTSAYTAEFGRYAGAQVNVVTRAGTNALNGTGYLFVRNGAFDARNVFAPETEPAPEYSRYQTGGSVGGPLVRSKAFFFADYEATRRREGITRLTTVPTLAERAGDFSQSIFPLPRNPLTGQPLPFIPSFAQHPVGRSLVNLYPEPNRASPTANFVSSPIERDDTHQFDVRVDRAWAAGGELTFRYSFSDRDLFEPFTGPSQAAVPGYGDEVPRRAQSFLANDSRAWRRSWHNDARFAATRVSSAVNQEGQGVSLNRQVGLPDLSNDPRDWGLSYISVLGYSPLGHEINNPQESTTTTLQLADTVTWARGAHLIRFGGDVRTISQDAFRDVLSRGQLIFTGQITNNSLADLLLGLPVVTVGARLDNPQHLRTHTWSLFAQDSWQLRANVTLDAGLRYEVIAPPVDRDDRANLYDPATGTLMQVGTGGLPRGGYDPDGNNVAPRIGLTWSPSDGNTVIRGGYGLYFSQSALAPSEALYFSPPYYQASFYFPLPAAGVFLSLSDPFPANFPVPTPPSALTIQPDLETPSLHHWNVGVSQELPASWWVQVAYAGSRGQQLLAARDVNQPAPSAAPINPRPNPFFADITALESRAHSQYHAFIVSGERRLSRGFSVLSSYTWSTSKDDASGFFASSGDPNFPQDSRDPEAEWGRSNFDVRHRLIAGFVYDLPFGRDTVLARDWQVSGIVTVQSGRPFTVALLPDLDNSNTGRSSLGFGANDRPNLVGDPEVDDRNVERWFDTAAFALPPYGTFGSTGRNTLEGPGFANVNFAVLKVLPLYARARVQLRFEAFNLFNRANYNLPDNFFGSPTFGQVLSAQAPRRIQLGARVLF
jgi:Carboxypeptidase regulatory-like domain/TonB dependent receptor